MEMLTSQWETPLQQKQRHEYSGQQRLANKVKD